MKRKREKVQVLLVVSLVLRYLFLLLIGITLFYSDIFYNFLLILTIYPLNFLLNFFYSSTIIGNKILMDSFIIELVPACIAVSGYFLLLILNFTTSIPVVKRVKSLLFLFFALLLANILRIFILSLLIINNFAYFDIVHKVTWYTLDIILVAAIWFFGIYKFKIEKIPVYSDFKMLLLNLKTPVKYK
jgi:hypothetical protein